MATLVIVGARDAALEAARAAGHQVVLVSDRKPLRRRKDQILGFVRADLETCDPRGTPWLQEVVLQAHGATPIAAVLAATERAVFAAALIRQHLQIQGNDPDCAYLCRNKFAMKQRVRAAGLPCTDFARITPRSSPIQLIKQLGLPMVLKPMDASGSRGSVLARFQREVEQHFAVGLLAETFVHGIEMSVESFVSDGRVLFTNLTEYLLPLWANIVPATLPADSHAQLCALNEAVIQALGIQRGMTHMEIFLTAEGPIFSELAIRPPGGYLMDLMQRAYGFDPWRAAIDIELGAPVDLPQRPRNFSGMWLLHPGKGTVRRVHGQRACKQIPGIVEVSCRVGPGDPVSARAGSGESSAYFIAEGASRAEVITSLNVARKTLLIELQPHAAR
jgi:biotin carboxylase